MPEPSEASVVAREIRVEAEPQVVFEFFTDPRKMVRWFGIGATLDPRPGGTFRVDTIAGRYTEGEFVVVERPRRLVFTWGFGGLPDAQADILPPGSSTVEVELVPDGEATIVRLTHRVPAALAELHATGWENYLGRLRAVATGKDPGRDRFAEAIEKILSGA